MCHHDPMTESPPPPLTDETAVAILDLLHDVLTTFENRYCTQIQRYYRLRSHHNLFRTDRDGLPDDPPF